MSLTKRVGLLAGTAALSMTSGSLAGTGAGTDQDLAARLAAAEAKIAELSAASSDKWLTDQRAAEIRNIVQDVLADADTRASLLTQGVTAGYDGGAVLGSADGNWLLKTNFHMQQRYIYNNASAATGSGTDENVAGFESTRAKFIITGHVVSPDWFYRVDHNVASNGNAREGTLNAYVGHDYGNGWKIAMGTMKAPLLREELVEAHHQLVMERSLLNYIFSAGYVDGIEGMYEGEQFRFAISYNDGHNSGMTGWGVEDTEWAFTGRVEWLASGTYDQFSDFTSPQGSEMGILVGGAIHYEKGEYGTPTADELEVLILTIDGSFEGDGWNAYAAWMYADLDDDAAFDVNPNGFLVQGGFYLADTLELYGRYEWADFDTSGIEDHGVFTIGVNKYFAGHNAKWTTDIVIATEEIDATVSGISPGSTGGAYGLTGVRPDDVGEDGQFAFRTQISIFF